MISSLLADSQIFSAVVTGFFTILICYLVHIDLIRFASCTFMGGFSAFATGGNWKMLVICMVCGNIVGILSTILGNFLYKHTNKNGIHRKKEWVILKFFDD